MLGHSDHDRRQFGHLTPRRLGDIDALAFGERARARSAAVGPMLNDPVDLLGRKQPPVPALVPVLPAPLPTRPLAARTTRSRRGILRRRKRRVPRTPAQTTLELSNPSLEPPVRLDQTLVRIHQLLKPQQQPNRCLTIAIEDRLGLGPLHAKPFAAGPRVPAPPERLRFTFRIYLHALQYAVGMEPFMELSGLSGALMAGSATLQRAVAGS